MSFVRANGNMPHRCPECHRVNPRVRYTKRGARWFRRYHCAICNVWWHRWWQE